MMTNQITIGLIPDAAGQKFIIIKPEHKEPEDDGLQQNKIYRLYLKAVDEQYIGDMALGQESQRGWIYTGYYLSKNEQEQIAGFIKKYEEADSETDTLYIQAFYNGGMNGFEIVPHGKSYSVAYDGKIIANIQHNEVWEQVSGETLPDDVLTTLYQGIENHYHLRLI
jgi:hypothetical protein